MWKNKINKQKLYVILYFRIRIVMEVVKNIVKKIVMEFLYKTNHIALKRCR